MSYVEEVCANKGLAIGLTARFTNCFDADFLLGKVFWCGCEFVTFATQNMCTNFDYVFLTAKGMHTLPYNTKDKE
ncbi:Auxin-induced protein 5NG4 [Hordeum vulgare]|nr:Auxin-induced protein 5NG4 [Hordeum vulgare]